MRRISDLIKWFILAFLIFTVLLLNIYLLVYYRHAPVRKPAELDRLTNNHKYTDNVQIPKIIHLMWSERLVPNKQLKYVAKWAQLNQDWKIWFWTGKTFDKFIKSKYPSRKKIYDGLQKHDRIVSRRYFIIHHFGGVWADLDVEPLKPLDTLLRNQSCLLSQEPLVNAKLGWHIDMMVGAAIFACRPGHPYFELVLNLLIVSGKDPHTLAATGGVMLSRVYARYRQMTSDMEDAANVPLNVAEPDVFMPKLGESYLTTLKTDCSKLDHMTDIRKPFCDHYRPLNFQNGPIPNSSYTAHHWYRAWTKIGKEDKSTTDKSDFFEVVKAEEPKW